MHVRHSVSLDRECAVMQTRTSGRAGNKFDIVRSTARVVPLCSVNETLAQPVLAIPHVIRTAATTDCSLHIPASSSTLCVAALRLVWDIGRGLVTGTARSRARGPNAEPGGTTHTRARGLASRAHTDPK